MIRTWFLWILSGAALAAQSVPSRPLFSHYPVKQIYKGAPAPPKLDKDERMFRTVIRTGAKSEVQFAGRYTIPMFGCGALCSAFYIVDSVTGRVYDGFGIAELPRNWEEQESGNLPDRIQFKPDSRLLKINGCPNEENCGYYDYVMVDGQGLKLIQQWLLPKEFQY